MTTLVEISRCDRMRCERPADPRRTVPGEIAEEECEEMFEHGQCGFCPEYGAARRDLSAKCKKTHPGSGASAAKREWKRWWCASVSPGACYRAKWIRSYCASRGVFRLRSNISTREYPNGDLPSEEMLGLVVDLMSWVHGDGRASIRSPMAMEGSRVSGRIGWRCGTVWRHSSDCDHALRGLNMRKRPQPRWKVSTTR